MTENDASIDDDLPGSPRPGSRGGRFRVLFVCLGNICRSPAAENVFRHQARLRELADRVDADSAGVMDWHTGKAPDSRMTRAAEARGIAMSGKARAFQRSDFEAFDMILTMDRENYAAVLSAAHTQAERAKVVPFAELVLLEEVHEIPDPYFGGPEGFELVLDLLEAGCSTLLDRIEKGSAARQTGG